MLLMIGLVISVDYFCSLGFSKSVNFMIIAILVEEVDFVYLSDMFFSTD